MSLRLGMLVLESDFRMLRLPPQQELRRRGGADAAAMEAWAEKHCKDPRRSKWRTIWQSSGRVAGRLILTWRRAVERTYAPGGGGFEACRIEFQALAAAHGSSTAAPPATTAA